MLYEMIDQLGVHNILLGWIIIYAYNEDSR